MAHSVKMNALQPFFFYVFVLFFILIFSLHFFLYCLFFAQQKKTAPMLFIKSAFNAAK